MASADDQPPNAFIPVKAAKFAHPLTKLAARLAAHEPVKIVAIGSSSVAGESGIVPFPYHLEMLLREKLADATIDVLNRGKGGEEASKERARFETDVLRENPCTVIWQVGTNAVWKDDDLKLVASEIAQGVDELRKAEIDVVLMDLQYVPAVISSDKIERANQMVAAIDVIAAEKEVNVFRRFDMMRRWCDIEKISFDRMLNPNDPQRLHHSDYSSVRIAVELRDCILDALRT